MCFSDWSKFGNIWIELNHLNLNWFKEGLTPPPVTVVGPPLAGRSTLPVRAGPSVGAGPPCPPPLCGTLSPPISTGQTPPQIPTRLCPLLKMSAATMPHFFPPSFAFLLRPNCTMKCPPRPLYSMFRSSHWGTPPPWNRGRMPPMTPPPRWVPPRPFSTTHPCASPPPCHTRF
jgi:hypothetical protein